MNYYLDITLLPDAEDNLGFIWQKVFQQVHIALVEHGYEAERKLNDGSTKKLKNSRIAVSFPEYFPPAKESDNFSLGSVLRLHSQTKEELEKLNIKKWLERLMDYACTGEIKTTPSNSTFVVFKQKRVKGVKRVDQSLQKKAKHIADKFGVDLNTCYNELKLKHPFEKDPLPYIQLESQTTRKLGKNSIFKIFIEKLDCDESSSGEYDCYGLGLSQTATVPWF